MGDEPGENSAFRGNLKTITYFSPWSKMSSIYTRANVYLEKCKILLFITSKLSNVLLLAIRDTSKNSL